MQRPTGLSSSRSFLFFAFLLMAISQLVNSPVALAETDATARDSAENPGAQVVAKENAPTVKDQEKDSTVYLNPLIILDEIQSNFKRPTTPQRVSQDFIKNTSQTDATKALKQISGVYTRDEDGFGLRPNIGLRGTNPDRSKKISFYQDGLLIGPAPYAAPAAYYSPSILLQNSIEVFKGFGAVPYGPNSIGGSVQYNTAPLRFLDSGKIKVMGGSYDTGLIQVDQESAINPRLSTAAHVGVIRTRGFKDLPSGKNSGFYQYQSLFKVGYHLNEAQTHTVEARFGLSSEQSNETYLGISPNDFSSQPYSRYEASSQDQMNWKHLLFQIEDKLVIGDSGLLKISAYSHTFDRNWNRFDRFADGTSVLEVLKNPDNFSYSPYSQLLKGERDSSSLSGNQGLLINANNHRTYLSQGIQAQFNDTFKYSSVEHEFEIGARLHRDSIRRDHDLFEHAIINGGNVATGNQSKETLNRDSATAKTIFTRNDLIIEKWTASLVGRLEDVDFNFRDDLNAIDRSRHDSVFIPGVGLAYRLTPRLSTRLSYNQAASLSGVDTTGNEVREKSDNYEAEIKYYDTSSEFSSELVLFENRYQNITGTCTQSTGCANSQLDRQYNGGKALIQGAEFRASQLVRWNHIQFPLQLNVTRLNARFRSQFESTSAEWGTGVVENNSRLPYVPDWMYSAVFGTVYNKWRQDVIFTYSSSLMDQSVNAGQIQIPAYGIVDYSTQFKLDKKSTVSLKIDNVLAKEYAVSFRPYGMRPGKPFTAMIGYTFEYE